MTQPLFNKGSGSAVFQVEIFRKEVRVWGLGFILGINTHERKEKKKD